MGAAVMRRDDLNVLNGSSAVTGLVLDPRIRELDVPIVVWQLVFLSPSSDSLGPLLRRFSLLAALAVFCLEEALVLPLQILFEDNASHRFTSFGETLGGLRVSAVDPAIVGQLTGLGDADVEGLPIAACAGPSRSFEDVSAPARERHQIRTRVPDHIRNRLHEAQIA
jgi:hypothetical protein